MIFNRKKPTPSIRTRGNSMPPGGPNRIFTYYASRSQSELATGREPSQNKPPLRRLPTRFQRLRKHSAWFAGAFVLICLGVYQLQLSTTPKVVSLAPTSVTPFLQDTEVYKDAAQKLFNANAANRNKLTVNSTGIALRLQKQFPELQEVSVSLPVIGATPTIFVRPAEPALVLAAANGIFVVDENGRALAEATAGLDLGGLKVPTVTDQSSITVKLGEQILPRTATSFIATVSSQLAASKATVQSMTMPALAGELDVYLTGKPYFIKFNMQQGGAEAAALQSGTYLAVSKQLDREKVTPSQYVDVRLEGRAYYK